jgi:hypothetical protein
MNMPLVSNLCGIILIIIGIVGYIHGTSTGHASPTALIPAAFGILFLIFGVVSGMKESLRKHLMHAAAVVALLGLLAVGGRLLSNISGLSMSAAVLSQLAMAVVCLVFLILAIRSFAAARRAREAGQV